MNLSLSAAMTLRAHRAGWRGWRRCLLTFQPPPGCQEEKVLPVVLVSGELLSNSIWSDVIDKLSANGYSGFAIETGSIVTDSDTEREVQALRDAVMSQRMVPPAMIAHSMAAYLGLKYLESHALEGFMMVSPFLQLQQDRGVVLRTPNNEERGLKRHYKYNDLPAGLVSEGGSAVVGSQELLEPVLLEPGNVPMAIVYTKGDTSLTENQVASILRRQCIDAAAQSCMYMKSIEHRVPMLDRGHREDFSTKVLDWLDNI